MRFPGSLAGLRWKPGSRGPYGAPGIIGWLDIPGWPRRLTPGYGALPLRGEGRKATILGDASADGLISQLPSLSPESKA